jgi:hypothetical protein
MRLTASGALRNVDKAFGDPAWLVRVIDEVEERIKAYETSISCVYMGGSARSLPD